MSTNYEQDLKREFVALGGKLNKNLENKLLAIEDIGIAKHATRKQQSLTEKEERPSWANKAAEIAGVGLSVVSLAFTFTFVLGGLFFGTLVLIAAELIAVHDGFAIIDPSRAWLYSTAIILFYIVVLFIEQMVIDKDGYEQVPKLSLTLIGRSISYFVGFKDENWSVQYKQLTSSSQHIMRTVKFFTWTIVSFGLLGRLGDKISEYDDLAWHESAIEILLNSSLTDMLGYVGMFVATMALLWGTKWVVHFIYGNFRNVTGGVVVKDFSSASIVVLSPAQMIEAERTQLMQREILALKAKS